MNFIGQKTLLNTLNSFTIQTLPHTILFLGEDGCGKKTMTKYLANKLGLQLITFEKDTSIEQIIDYQNSSVKTLYLIDLSILNLEKEQNKFLKFIEEPGINVYIVLINSSEIGILPTILNRCYKIRFEPYTISQLKQIKDINNSLVYKVCHTPGQLQDIDEAKLTSMYNLCETIVLKLTQASYANTMSVAAKINYKEDYTKFNFETFLNLLECVSLDFYLNKKYQLALQIYLYIIKRRQELVQNSKIQKEAFLLNLLDGLWKEVR